MLEVSTTNACLDKKLLTKIQENIKCLPSGIIKQKNSYFDTCVYLVSFEWYI